MKRNPRKVKWTKAYRRVHAKDLAVDTTFEFERKRNRPERYDRTVVENTLKAMKRVEEIREKRQAKFWEKRMKGKKAQEKRESVAELEQNIHLVKAPVAMAADPSLTLPEKMKVKVATHREAEPMEG